MNQPNRPAQQPDALRHAGTEIGKGARRPPPRKRKGNGEKRSGLPPVVVPEEIVSEFVRVTRYLPSSNETKARIALVHVVMACPGAQIFPEEDVWHQVGTWTSRLRGMKEFEGITKNHHGQAAAQKILIAMRRAEHDPALSNKLRSHISRFIRSVLQSLNAQLTSMLSVYPDLSLTPDEMMNMVPFTGDLSHYLFKKPKTKSRVIVPESNATQDISKRPVTESAGPVVVQKENDQGISIVKRGLLKVKKFFKS